MPHVQQVAVELQEDQCLHFSPTMAVRYNVTSCTEEPPVGIGRNFCASGDNLLRRPVHVHLPPGNRIILTADEQLRQELIQFCTYKVAIS